MVGRGLLEDGADVFAGAGKGDGLDKSLGVGPCRALHPPEHIGPAGVVVRQGEGVGDVGGGVPAGDLGEVKGSGVEVGPRMQQVPGKEAAVASGVGPLLGGVAGDLHETQLALGANGGCAEPALAPDDGLDQLRGEAVLGGGG